MKILALETTTSRLVLGIYGNAKIYECNLDIGRKLSSLLVPTIQRVLEALDWEVKDIDYFICGLGPGSFTAMRLGISAIKGMAWSVHKPVIGISTLDILARNVKTTSGYIAVVIDAKRNLIYTALYRIKDSKLKRMSADMLLTEKEFFKKINPVRNRWYSLQNKISNGVKNNTVILGDAVGLYKDKMSSQIKGVTLLDKDYWYPQAGNMITLGLERISAQKFDSVFKLKPIYLYPQECQIKNSNVKAQNSK